MTAVKVCTEILGITQLPYDWGMEVSGKVMVDSCAAIGVAHRRGNGKVRHVRIKLLWIQEKVEESELVMEKVVGEKNPADLLTKYLTANKSEQFVNMAGQEYRGGRADQTLELARDTA